MMLQFNTRKQEEETNLKNYLRDQQRSLADQHRQKQQQDQDREMLEDKIRVLRAKQAMDDDAFKKLLLRHEFNQA